MSREGSFTVSSWSGNMHQYQFLQQNPPALKLTITLMIYTDLFDFICFESTNMPSCKEGRKSSLFMLSFLMSCSDEVAFYNGLRHEADFLRTLFCKFFDCHCLLACLFLSFNKCITQARLALSHRQTKML